ncbi:class I SAM-dependent methyltransferase [Rhodoplanes azumiensis]|uniref:Class I SAM-dependent methyltransferase n=1 Tax=Rhodoplanes azumiensis TaxID=1897628 RepID=A0ABW5AJL5_9BRAD
MTQAVSAKANGAVSAPHGAPAPQGAATAPDAPKPQGASISAGFWDEVYTTNPIYSKELSDEAREAIRAAAAWFGDLSGKTVLDLGCGAGASSLLLAELGADVISVDASPVAIASLTERCRARGVTRVRPVVCDAMTIDTLGPVDFVYGSMILHHLEPFGAFCQTLRRTIRPGGRAFFWENNAASDLLLWFRKHVVGKLWVPKYGDEHEFPLTPSEIATLRGVFDVTTEHPRMEFFALASLYLLRGKLMKPMVAIDDFLFRHGIGTRYSYQQYVRVQG